MNIHTQTNNQNQINRFDESKMLTIPPQKQLKQKDTRDTDLGTYNE